MKHQQAVFLQEMGITHWQVRKPALFKTEEALKQLNLSACKLLVVCTEEDAKHELMAAIISAFQIKSDQVVYCSLAQFENQQGNLPTLIWSTLGEVASSPSHQLLNSPSLAELATNAAAKKVLWKQFCAYQQ
ncbi:DNA polymerase III subunit psi [Vibrio sp. 1-Bac 57]